MLSITPRMYSLSLHVDKHTAYRRLKPQAHEVGPRGEHHYPLVSALTTARPREFVHLARAIEGATDRPCSPINPERLADEFEIWLRTDPRQHKSIDRLKSVRRAYAAHLANAVQSSELLRHLNYLQNVLPVENDILRYVLIGDTDALPPNFKKWCLSHAIQSFQPTQEAA